MDVAASFWGGGGIGRSADCTYVEDVEIANITTRHPQCDVGGSRHMSLLSLL